jgi:hypothetical protein
MTHNNKAATMRIFLFAGLLEIVLGVSFLAGPAPHADILEVQAGDANTGVRTTRSERVSPIISFVLLASGIALTVAGVSTRTSEKLTGSPTPGNLSIKQPAGIPKEHYHLAERSRSPDLPNSSQRQELAD